MNRYEKILGKQRPIHDQDAFSARHPPMPPEKRAKLFAPFDALTGYSEALREQEIVYQERAELGEAKQQELDDKLQRLWQLYQARKRCDKWAFEPPAVTITYFEEAPEQGGRGLYRTASGAVVRLDLTHRFLRLQTGGGTLRIELHDIYDYSGDALCEESSLYRDKRSDDTGI